MHIQDCRSSISAAMPRSDFHKVEFVRRCATVFKMFRDSSLSDTARAVLMASRKREDYRPSAFWPRSAIHVEAAFAINRFSSSVMVHST